MGLTGVVFDTETTGLNPSTDCIIEIGAWKFKDGVSVDKFQSFVSIDKRIPTNIMQLTGIIDKDLEGAGSIQEVLLEFYNFVGDNPLIGFNLPFDINFIEAKGRYYGLSFVKGRLGLDALPLVRSHYRGLECYKLEYLVKYFQIEIPQSHRALYDAYATKLVVDRCPSYTFTPLDKGDYGTPKETMEGLPLF